MSNDMIIYANRKILNRTVWITYKRWLVNLVVFIFVLLVNQHLNFEMNSYWDIVKICIPYTIGVLVLFFVIATLSERDVAKYAFALIKSKMKK